VLLCPALQLAQPTQYCTIEHFAETSVGVRHGGESTAPLLRLDQQQCQSHAAHATLLKTFRVSTAPLSNNLEKAKITAKQQQVSLGRASLAPNLSRKLTCHGSGQKALQTTLNALPQLDKKESLPSTLGNEEQEETTAPESEAKTTIPLNGAVGTRTVHTWKHLSAPVPQLVTHPSASTTSCGVQISALKPVALVTLPKSRWDDRKTAVPQMGALARQASWDSGDVKPLCEKGGQGGLFRAKSFPSSESKLSPQSIQALPEGHTQNYSQSENKNQNKGLDRMSAKQRLRGGNGSCVEDVGSDCVARFEPAPNSSTASGSLDAIPEFDLLGADKPIRRNQVPSTPPFPHSQWPSIDGPLGRLNELLPSIPSMIENSPDPSLPSSPQLSIDSPSSLSSCGFKSVGVSKAQFNSPSSFQGMATSLSPPAPTERKPSRKRMRLKRYDAQTIGPASESTESMSELMSFIRTKMRRVGDEEMT